ncbi:MAG: hypothetical protein LBR55_07240, partial [Bacteroidales bacterium]|nr:hypothetical protein [Bacteroidales bacterium]
MKRILMFLIVTLTVTNLFAQNEITSDSLDSKIKAHFEEYRSELFRYGGLSYYGETVTVFEKGQIEKELNLFREVKNSELISNPTNSVFALCHNILIHTPEKGKDFLKLLNKPTTNDDIINFLWAEMIFAGEFGEQLALDNVESNNAEWSNAWAFYLRRNAIYESSIPRIEKIYNQTNDIEIKVYMISALMYISNPKSIDFIKQIIETTQNDDIQEAAMFAHIELAGYDGMEYFKEIKTVGEKSKKEKEGGLDWLKTGTSSKNKFGVGVENDTDFIDRFGDLKSPVVSWAIKEGLLKKKSISKPVALERKKKDELLDLLIQSKGFGLEMIKAQLFLSLEPTDIDNLLKLRQMCFYSPNDFSIGRQNTIGICV